MQSITVYNRSPLIASCNLDINIFHVLFFLKGFLWFNAYRYGAPMNSLLNYGLVFFYLFENFRHGSLRFNHRFRVVVLFSLVWLLHLCFTGFLESIRPGLIRERYMVGDMSVEKVYGKYVYHLLYGPFRSVIKKILKTFFDIFRCYLEVELLLGDKENKLLRIFSWGTMIALPFIFLSLYGRPMFSPRFVGGGFRFAPEITPGHHMHPNQVALLFLFAFFANMIAMVQEKIKAVKFCHVFYCVVAVCIILLTGGRSCTICLVIALTYLFFTVWKKHLFSMIATLLIFGVILTFALNYLMSINIITENPIVSRMSVETAEQDRGSGRLDAWKNYYRFISMKQLCIGVGPLATTSTIIYDKYPLYGGFIDHPSNTYLYILFTYGIGGFIIFMMFTAKIFINLRANILRKHDILDYIAMGMLLGVCVFRFTAYYRSCVGPDSTAILWIYMISRALRK